MNIITILESKYEGANRPGYIQLTFAEVDNGEPRIITTVPAADAADLTVGSKYRFAPELVAEQA
ncbi:MULTISPECIES: hypothetical protein [Gammaproteobacteria]|uniref:hypothetical protein n=1 Tax=Gammaproteobacteria TaxID=1236 RepID=UPI001128A4E8|nr:hypothetical protein [Pseudomonas sp. Hp2]